MKTLTKFFSFFCLCLLATGCVIEAPTLPNDDEPPTTCGIDESTCASGQICAVVDPCGSACLDAGPGDPCPQVCIEVLGCVTPLTEEETCDPYANHCGAGLECQIDGSAGCGPTGCYAEGCAQCPPIFTCQSTQYQPSTCEEMNCGDGFRCEVVVDEGCGYSDPETQRVCEAGQGQFAVCVPEPSIDECDPSRAGSCQWNEVCAPDLDQCIPSQCDGEICTDDCWIPFTCQPITCGDVSCPEGARCEAIEVYYLCNSEEGCDAPAYVELICVPDNDHIIGDSCDDTTCLPGHSCVETYVYLPCDGPGCEEPAGVHVSCEPNDGPVPPAHPAERCDTDSDCGEAFECRYDATAMCEPSFCEDDLCTQDCVDVFTCQPIEELLPPTPVPGPPSEPSECQPDADDCEAGLTCQIDHDAPCEPSFCDGNVCTDDCRVVFTCQPENHNRQEQEEQVPQEF